MNAIHNHLVREACRANATCQGSRGICRQDYAHLMHQGIVQASTGDWLDQEHRGDPSTPARLNSGGPSVYSIDPTGH
ncbi:MAG TPA: hypothetical protein VKA68_14885 [bacterium]|nr:hypothetical protein [bacterium]